MKIIKSCCFSLLILVFLSACTSNRLEIQLPHEEIPINYINIDKAFFEQTREQIQEVLPIFIDELGDAFLIEMGNNLGHAIDDTSAQALYDFYHREPTISLEKEKKKLSDSLEYHTNKTTKAFQYLAYYFGEELVPKNIIFINKRFSNIRFLDSTISVGLENYISPSAEIIKAIPTEELYNWQRKRMNIKYLERDIVLSWIQGNLFHEMEGKFSEHLIQAGKILYLLNACFPTADEKYIMRYDDKSYQWAKQNEEMVWNFLVQQQLLFKNDMNTTVNFLNEGPTTVGLPEGAPDRMGQFIGYQIVKNYMNKNKDVSLSELIDIKYNRILQTYEIE